MSAILKIPAMAVFLMTGASPAPTQEDDVEKAMAAHFTKVIPELYRFQNVPLTREAADAKKKPTQDKTESENFFARFRGVRLYGETLSGTRPSDESFKEEQDLLVRARESGMLKKPSNLIVALCHNLLIFQPESGRATIEELNQLPYEEQLTRYLRIAALASGQWGEEFAIRNLQSLDDNRRKFWVEYLATFAIYEESIEPLKAEIEREKDAALKARLVRALIRIGSPTALPSVRQLLQSTESDEVQAAATYAYVELAGHDGISFVEQIKPLGAKASKERDQGLAWLRDHTNPRSPFGDDIKNDAAFMRRFVDLRSPIMLWLREQKMADVQSGKDLTPQSFSADQKQAVIELLLDSKAFGLEAVKGPLLRSVTRDDLPALLQLRAENWYSPCEFSQGRMKTINILIRHVRRTAN